MAIGVSFIAKAPSYQADRMSYLFGNILLVPRESLWFMVALGALLSVTGLAMPYGPDLPAGPTIILLAGGDYVLPAILTQILGRRRAQLAVARGA